MKFGLGGKKTNDMEKCDPMFEFSIKFKFLISTVFISYPDTLKDLRQKAKQTRLMYFFKRVWEGKSPTPSTNHKSQTPQAELPDVNMLPSSMFHQLLSWFCWDRPRSRGLTLQYPTAPSHILQLHLKEDFYECFYNILNA